MADGPEWEGIASTMSVVKLNCLVQILVPSLIFTAFSKSTRGLTFYLGRAGLLFGPFLIAGSLLIGWLLYPEFGIPGALLSFWVAGTSGIVILTTSIRPLAFVKPICTRCRLLPVIKEHEALHLAGEPREGAVWASMKTRHSVESLGLEGDPAICSFCPIPKRLAKR